MKDVSPDLQSLFRSSVQPYMISWLKYNPANELAKVDSRVLILQGTTDLQVVATDAEALKKGKPDAKIVYMVGMNHVLKMRQLIVRRMQQPIQTQHYHFIKNYCQPFSSLL